MTTSNNSLSWTGPIINDETRDEAYDIVECWWCNADIIEDDRFYIDECSHFIICDFCGNNRSTNPKFDNASQRWHWMWLPEADDYDFTDEDAPDGFGIFARDLFQYRASFHQSWCDKCNNRVSARQIIEDYDQWEMCPFCKHIKVKRGECVVCFASNVDDIDSDEEVDADYDDYWDCHLQ